MKKIILAILVSANFSTVCLADETSKVIDCSNLDIVSAVENKNRDQIVTIYETCRGQAQAFSILSKELSDKSKLEENPIAKIALVSIAYELSFRYMSATAASLNLLRIAASTSK